LLVRAIEHREEHLPKISSLCEDDSQIPNLPVDGECVGTDTPAGDRPIDAQHERKPRITAVQRRADALVAVANASLGNAGLCNAELTNSRLANTETTSDAQAALHTSAPSANADRHMVVTHIDVEALVAAEQQVAGEPKLTCYHDPRERRADCSRAQAPATHYSAATGHYCARWLLYVSGLRCHATLGRAPCDAVAGWW